MAVPIEGNIATFAPGPADVHTHPRVFDVITLDNFVPANNGQEGKAGLGEYSLVALKSGITAAIAMPNESMRLLDLEYEEQTNISPYPISTKDKVLAVAAAISHESVIPYGIHQGIDPTEIFLDEDQEILDGAYLLQQFDAAKDEVLSLKLYGAETTGGFNIAIKHFGRIAELWNEVNPDKPIVMHLEGADVGTVLSDIYNREGGKRIPVHIAHVSSRQELEAVIEAKRRDMDVSCEATPHHLFLDDEIPQLINNYGCVKPSLKTQKDIEYLWAFIDYVDIFASDCAPHRRSDKEAAAKTWGMANHSVMLPLLLGAVERGRLTIDQLYEKLCINPRRRFNLPEDDNSILRVDLMPTSISEIEQATSSRYGWDPFAKLEKEHQQRFHLIGHIVEVRAGKSSVEVEGFRWDMARYQNPVSSYKHLIRPKNH